ncbi:MAG: HAD-IA family hydrolase [Gammaproteobacteria bacterium]|nr:HAD-IA family hydrolase [Gammaproteobacteria bacterium]
MSLSAVFFGSIGVLAETSDIQRRAYNEAFVEAGLDWHWDEPSYRRLLADAGGRRRLRQISATTDAGLDDAAILALHARKTEIACEQIRSRGINLRPGVAELIKEALGAGISLGLVTTTYRENIDAIADAAGSALPLDRFAVVLTVTDAEQPKPAADIYEIALARLDLEPAAAVAIEDSAVSVAAAKAADLMCIATPGVFTAGQDFSAADAVFTNLADTDGGHLSANLAVPTGRVSLAWLRQLAAR